MKVLVATDKPFAKVAVDGIRKEIEAAGYEFALLEKYTEKAQLLDAVKDANAIIIRSDIVDAEVLDAAKELKIVVRAGAGYDNVDLAAATAHNVCVMNTPGQNSNAVAELALAEILSIPRFVHTSNVEMREGIWGKKAYKGEEVLGKTLGLIGYGRIAKSLAEKAKALGMDIIFFDPGVEENTEGHVSFDEILAKSDFISLHIPGGEANYHIIGAEEFGKMKDGVYLIDLARGGVVDEEALVDAIESGKVKAAALDVYEEEPTKNDRILQCKAISITPHIGASTKEAQKRIGQEVVDILKENFPL